MNIALHTFEQAIVRAGTGLGDIGLIVAGIFILAIGMVLNYFVPNRLWIIVDIVGVIVIILGVLVLVFGPLW